VIRAFLAVPASAEIRERYARRLAEWRSTFRGLKWVEPENIHITVRFLGDTKEPVLEPLRRGLEERLAGLPPVQAHLGPPGAFGSKAAPRTLWVGLSSGAVELEEMARRVEAAVREQGFPPERKPWTAHLTLARNKQSGRVPGWKEALDAAGLEGCVLDVGGVSLLSSTLLPRGPIYTEVWRVPLGSA